MAGTIQPLKNARAESQIDLGVYGFLINGSPSAAFGLLALTASNALDFRNYIGAGTNSFSGAYADLSGVPSTFTPSAHTHTESEVTNLVADLGAKAPLASPALTGTPTAPTPVDATSNTQVATTAFVHSLLTALINASPATLDTLKELADAIGDDPNFATTVATSIATKLAKASNLSDLTDAAAALTNLGLTANGKSLVTAANYAAMKTLLAVAVADITDATANGRSLISAANYAAMRTLLGLVIGTNVAASGTNGDITALTALTAGSVTQPAWTAPTLQNSWVNYNAGFIVAGYRKDSLGKVHVRGMITGGTATDGTGIMTLPAGFRPTGFVNFPVVSNGAFARVRVASTGDLQIYGVNNADLQLAGISFWTD